MLMLLLVCSICVVIVNEWVCGGQEFENNYFAKILSGSEAGSYLKIIDFCITQL